MITLRGYKTNGRNTLCIFLIKIKSLEKSRLFDVSKRIRTSDLQFRKNMKKGTLLKYSFQNAYLSSLLVNKNQLSTNKKYRFTEFFGK
jgi:hypothetical protein